MRAVVVEQRLFVRQHGRRPVAAGFEPPVLRSHMREVAAAVPRFVGQHRLVRIGEIRVRIADQEGWQEFAFHGMIVA